ncbi:MAG: cytochrome c-type biogenesis protein CcmH [Anaerolineaceae bacterium]|nr:cytochrome c-type biogenesis protein CcmH [Anaerolineaceae bacterium]
MRYKIVLLFNLIFVSLLMMTGNVLAQGLQPTPSDDDVNAIAKQLYCPVCNSVTLDVCNSQACIQWRKAIRNQLAKGKTEQEILQYFEDQYGSHVLGIPPRSRLIFNAIPMIIIAAGAVIIIWVFYSRKTTLPFLEQSHKR